MSTDDVAPASQTTSITGTTDVQPVRLKIPSRGRYVQFTLSGDLSEQSNTISSLSTKYAGPRVR